jgi:hypothetical protein
MCQENQEEMSFFPELFVHYFGQSSNIGDGFKKKGMAPFSGGGAFVQID